VNVVTTFAAIAGALASIFIVVLGVRTLVTAGNRQRSAVEDNTKATKDNSAAIAMLTQQMHDMTAKVDNIRDRQSVQGDRLSRIEGSIRNGRT
jgi:TolA-binding protein